MAAKYEQWLTDNGLLRLKGWARDGLTDKQIAHNMGISRKTLAEWKKKYAPIGDALKNSKEVVDIEVENALYKSATGFVGPDGKYYPPNTTAQIFWLKNRKPAQWRNLDAKEQEARIDKLQAEGKALKAMLEPPENKQDDGFISALADNSDWEDYEQEAADAEDKPDAADDGSPV